MAGTEESLELFFFSTFLSILLELKISEIIEFSKLIRTSANHYYYLFTIQFKDDKIKLAKGNFNGVEHCVAIWRNNICKEEYPNW